MSCEIRKKFRHFENLWAFFIGGLIGCWLVGIRSVFPWNYTWLYSKGDGALTQLGFEFFRKAPLFQWPITSVPNYVSGSQMIIPTENAVTNLIAKVVGLFVPGNFQFVGLWIVLCFALQGYFGAKLLTRFIGEGSAIFFGSLFFVLSPALLFRVGVMNHYHLGAHWMILLGLYLYFDDDARARAWSTLLCFAMLTSVYIAAMLLAVFLAHQLKIILSTRDFRLSKIATPLSFAVLGFWLMGYLSMQGSFTGSNFFRLNAFAFLNPGYSDFGSFSRLLNGLGSPRLKHVLSEDWEGFQYVGTVVVAGLFIGLANLKWKSFFHSWRKYVPILAVGCGLFIFALSNRIFLFQHEICYWWPSLLLDLRQIFRGATRFGWPAYYLIMLFAIVQMCQFFSVKKLKYGIAIVAALMIVEAAPGIAFVQNEFSNSKSYESSIRDPQWSEIATKNLKLSIYPNFDLQVDDVTGDAKLWVDKWFDLAKFANDHDLSTNFGYVPRPLTEFIANQDAQISKELESGDLQQGTIYVLANKEVWERVSDVHGDQLNSLMIDGYYILVRQD